MTLRIFIHDVGHGQSIHAFTPNGQTIVIDLGCSSEFSPLKWLKDEHKISSIDSLVITHPHGDHIDEILEIERLGLTVRQLWRPKWLSEEDVRKANQANYSEKLDCYFNMNKRFNQPIESVDLVGNPEVSGGVKVAKYFSNECGTSNINNHSGVVVFEYHGVKVVIPGDNEPASWKALLLQPEFIKAITGAHVFMASHHGRESGYCNEVFQKMSPRLCVISDGRVQDTDATGRYSYHAAGWKVHSKSKESKDRNCLTTRSDGHIEIQIGVDGNNSPFLSVTTL